MSLFLTAKGIEADGHRTAYSLIMAHSELFMRHTDIPHSNLIDSYLNTHQISVPTTHENTAAVALHPEIKRSIESTFVLPRERYTNQSKENQVDITLQSRAKDIIAATKTENATMIIDNERIVEPDIYEK